MRKSRVRAIREQEIHNPEGMSSATFRAAKRRHSNGLNRVPQPKPISPMGHPGFPTNTVQIIRTWIEKKPKSVRKGRRKKVSRVITLKPVTQTNLQPRRKKTA